MPRALRRRPALQTKSPVTTPNTTHQGFVNLRHIAARPSTIVLLRRSALLPERPADSIPHTARFHKESSQSLTRPSGARWTLIAVVALPLPLVPTTVSPAAPLWMR
jgi:hypothetical protein